MFLCYVLGALATSSLASRDSLFATSSQYRGLRSRLVTISELKGGNTYHLKDSGSDMCFP